jgi:hypothetical protein
MNPRLWIPLATFVMGFLFAWLAKPAEDAPPPTEASAKRDSRLPRAKSASRRKPSAEKQADARVARLLEGGDWRPEPDEDYRSLVAALQRRAGLGGLGYNDMVLFKSIVASWYDSNPDEALYWVLGIGNPADERILLGAIVEHCADTDWQAAVALAELYGASAGREIEMPNEVRMVMGSLDPEDYVRIGRMFGPRWKDSSYEFADDFQFRETLELFGGEYKPANVLKEWARRDFSAAWEWASSRDESQFTRNSAALLNMANTWSEEADDDQAVEFAAYLMGEQAPVTLPSRNLEIVYKLLLDRPTADNVQSLLELAPGDRQEHLNGLLKIGALRRSTRGHLFREKLLDQMTVAERITAFESLPPAFRRIENSGIRQNFESILPRLGHSPEEIEWMLPAAAPEDSTQAPESNEPAQDPFE